MKIRSALVIGTALIFAAGCGSHEEPKPLPQEVSNGDVAPVERLPVRQVRQTLNLTRSETMSVALEILKRNNIPVGRLDEDQGLLDTKWIDVSDRACGHRMQGAPLRCRTTLAFKFEDFARFHSVVSARFDERCAVNEEIDLHCAATEGERIMLTMVDQLRQVDESQQPKRGWFSITTPSATTGDPYAGD